MSTAGKGLEGRLLRQLGLAGMGGGSGLAGVGTRSTGSGRRGSAQVTGWQGWNH